MDIGCKYISYEETGFFSGLTTDYIRQDDKLSPFYKYPVSLDGISHSIAERRQFSTPRILLVDELRKQYQHIELNEKQERNLTLLLSENTFTVCTAHQPNIFTGPLYFIYKILHAVKLADRLNNELPENHFVPVFYMGSEDADLDEIGHINLNGEKLQWDTNQTGAVGRMVVDKQFLQLIERIAGELGVQPCGKELIELFRSSYTIETTIQQATLLLVNELFKDFGLLILIPDNANLKAAFNEVVKKELVEQFSHPIVVATCEQLSAFYKAQASGRELNLFYLFNNHRERIEKINDEYHVSALGLTWTLDEVLAELTAYPDRFSGNVIIRPLFQETILPNIAFIGGGGEIAYWLELKNVFAAVGVPYPLLIIRNSFLLVNENQKQTIEKLGLTISDFFKPEHMILHEYTLAHSKHRLDLSAEINVLNNFYLQLSEHAEAVDITLKHHTLAIQTNAIKKIKALEKKLFRKEKKKLMVDVNRLTKLKHELFPKVNLQERQDNFSFCYARFGKAFINQVYMHSLTTEQQFALLELK